MGYCLRILSEDNRPLALRELMSNMQNIGFWVSDCGSLYRDEELLVHLAISQPGDIGLEAKRDEFRQEAGAGRAAEAILTRLNAVTELTRVDDLLWLKRFRRRHARGDCVEIL